MLMKRNAHTRPACRGFTLFETLVVIALLAIVATLTVPSFVAWRVRDQVDARARALLSTLSYARGEALRRGARVTVCRIDAARHCLAAGQPCKTGVVDWSCGWAVMIEHGGGFYPLRAQTDLAPVSIVGALTNLTFTPPAGQAYGSFRSFDIGPRVESKATQGKEWRRCIRIAAGGRARIVDGACGAAA
ncbi:type II secretion system protein GspH [Paraburkholderia caribensis]|nr:type II secretion system protein GspH [Paraburkholderia caribensis]AUT52653.1 prepilin-type N-terminal cleavage/methylation domain-containing protein [Paraburkholderia caribensis]